MNRPDLPPSAEFIAELRVLEESLWQSKTRYNTAYMAQILSSDFFEYGRSGRVYSRAEILSDTEHATTISAELPLSGFSVRPLSEDIAQVTYVSEVTYDGNVVKANRSSIWSRIAGRWRLRFHQGTAIVD